MGLHPDDRMTSDPPADDHGAADSEAFEEWLDQAADSKGVSRQELMNQMLSSYWILDELTGLVGETEFEGRADHRSPGPVESAPKAEGTNDSASDDSEGEQIENPSTEESIRGIHAAIQELIEAQTGAESKRSTEVRQFASVPPFDEGIVSVVSDLQRQIGKYESKLDDVETRQDSQFDRFSNEFQLLLDRVEDLERKQDEYAKNDDIDALAAEIGELDGRIEKRRTVDEKLESRYRELESRMDREFDSIEELFHRLLDALDDLDSELETATESYRDELEPIQQREVDRKRLEELKTDALTREIRRGTCENCGQRVDLALLESPACPGCTARFTGIEDGGWNPFRSPTLETETGVHKRT